MRAYTDELSFAVAMLTPENVAQVRRDGRLLVARLETARSLERCAAFEEQMPRDLESLHALLDAASVAANAIRHAAVPDAMNEIGTQMRELDAATARARETTELAIRRLGAAKSALAPDPEECARMDRAATARSRMREEMDRFRAALPELAHRHAGRWVVFLDGRVRSTHDDAVSAYAAAVADLGPTAGFVVAPASHEAPVRLSRGAARIVRRRAG